MSSEGYDRIVGALSNRGYHISDQTVANILKRHGIAPAAKRSQNMTWEEFIRSQMAVLAGIDFSVEFLTWPGLATDYVLFFLHLESRRVSLAGITRHPGPGRGAKEMARNANDESWGSLDQRRYA